MTRAESNLDVGGNFGLPYALHIIVVIRVIIEIVVVTVMV